MDLDIIVLLIFYKLTDFYCCKICIFMTVKTFLADKLKILILQWYRYAMCHYAMCDYTEYHGNLPICFVVQCPTNYPIIPSNYFVKKKLIFWNSTRKFLKVNIDPKNIRDFVNNFTKCFSFLKDSTLSGVYLTQI